MRLRNSNESPKQQVSPGRLQSSPFKSPLSARRQRSTYKCKLIAAITIKWNHVEENGRRREARHQRHRIITFRHALPLPCLHLANGIVHCVCIDLVMDVAFRKFTACFDRGGPADRQRCSSSLNASLMRLKSKQETMIMTPKRDSSGFARSACLAS